MFRKNHKKMWKYIQNIHINREPKAAALNRHRREWGGQNRKSATKREGSNPSDHAAREMTHRRV